MSTARLFRCKIVVRENEFGSGTAGIEFEREQRIVLVGRIVFEPAPRHAQAAIGNYLAVLAGDGPHIALRTPHRDAVRPAGAHVHLYFFRAHFAGAKKVFGDRRIGPSGIDAFGRGVVNTADNQRRNFRLGHGLLFSSDDSLRIISSRSSAVFQ